MKQILLIRKDLKMRRGKEIAQGSHASMAFIVDQIRKRIETNQDEAILLPLSGAELKWISSGMAKVCLQVQSEQELLDYHQKAKDHGIKSHLIRDSGRTEFGGVPTLTACAIGPDEGDKIDQITQNLKLY